MVSFLVFIPSPVLGNTSSYGCGVMTVHLHICNWMFDNIHDLHHPLVSPSACPTGGQQPLITMTTIKPEDSLATLYSLPYLECLPIVSVRFTVTIAEKQASSGCISKMQ